jgi:hypothetical protein
MIRVLRVARRGALKARVAAAEQLHGVLYSAPEELRQPLLGLKTKALVSACAAMRPGPLTSTTAATKTSLRTLARRWQQLQGELDHLDGQLQTLVAAVAPTLLALPGIGVDTAGQLLVTAGDNPQRLRSEAAFAHLCGCHRSRRPRAAPTVTGSTGLVTAAPITPCGASPWSACTAIHRPEPMSSAGPNTACPSSTSCAVSSATSPARSTPTSQAHRPPLHRLPKIGGIGLNGCLAGRNGTRACYPRPGHRIAGRAGYRSWMRIVLVVVAAAQVKPGEASRLRPGLIAGSSLGLGRRAAAAGCSPASGPSGWP